MRTFTWIAVAAALLGATACGGASTSGIDPVDTANFAVVQGKLATRDGATNALDGVVVTHTQTGRTAATDHEGSFQMHVPPNQPIHLAFDDPMWLGEAPHHRGPSEHQDPYEDGAEIDGDGVSLSPLGPQERCDIEVYIEDGAIVECHVNWGLADDAPHGGEYHLARDPLCTEVNAAGEVEFLFADGCLNVELEIDGFSTQASLDIYLVSPTGEEAYVAAMAIDSEGVGHHEMSWCEGDTLPFGAASPADLIGHGVIVFDELDAVVFRGHLPHHHDAGTGHHHHGWEDDDDGHHHGGPGEGPHHGM